MARLKDRHGPWRVILRDFRHSTPVSFPGDFSFLFVLIRESSLRVPFLQDFVSQHYMRHTFLPFLEKWFFLAFPIWRGTFSEVVIVVICTLKGSLLHPTFLIKECVFVSSLPIHQISDSAFLNKSISSLSQLF